MVRRGKARRDETTQRKVHLKISRLGPAALDWSRHDVTRTGKARHFNFFKEDVWYCAKQLFRA